MTATFYVRKYPTVITFNLKPLLTSLMFLTHSPAVSELNKVVGPGVSTHLKPQYLRLSVTEWTTLFICGTIQTTTMLFESSFSAESRQDLSAQRGIYTFILSLVSGWGFNEEGHNHNNSSHIWTAHVPSLFVYWSAAASSQHVYSADLNVTFTSVLWCQTCWERNSLTDQASKSSCAEFHMCGFSLAQRCQWV